MKVITTDDARAQLDSVCDQAMAGEVIPLQNRAGVVVELTPVKDASVVVIEPGRLAESYEADDWAAFENH